MKRAVAFCQVIEKEYKGKNHKVSSKLITEMVEVLEKAESLKKKSGRPHTLNRTGFVGDSIF